ncbi:hypothetical protein SLOPH_1841 [Spraguea lophii 42_110]|uniref:Protein kinase n=1 Tax=Spraguea lophii (strain 42_110) TaxID=1358809 RepID=S7XTW8_SPRLO|nr:hypothetical protein SLOPH_1841 [Spraguea lophii 42_110]
MLSLKKFKILYFLFFNVAFTVNVFPVPGFPLICNIFSFEDKNSLIFLTSLCLRNSFSVNFFMGFYKNNTMILHKKIIISIFCFYILLFYGCYKIIILHSSIIIFYYSLYTIHYITVPFYYRFIILLSQKVYIPMFFLKKVFSSKKKLSPTQYLEFCEFSTVKYKGLESSYFKYTTFNPNNMVNILKKIRHDNIIKILNTERVGSTFKIYTPVVYTFIYNNRYKLYNDYILYNLAKVIIFLNEKCNIAHNNIKMDSLFVNDAGILILGGFEKSTNQKACNDKRMFYDLEINRNKKSVEEIICECEDNIFIEIENRCVTFPVLKLNDKRTLVDKILRNDGKYTVDKKYFIENNVFPETVKNYLLGLYVPELNLESKESEEQLKLYKDRILKLIIFLDLDSYDLQIEKIFGVLDSNVRSFVLKNIDFFINKTSLWNSKSIFKSLSLGLKVKNLRVDTINSFSKILKFLEKKRVKELLKILLQEANKEILQITCNFLEENIEYLCEMDEEGLFKLIIYYLPKDHNRVLEIIDNSFDKLEMERIVQLLSILCSTLPEYNDNKIFQTIINILYFVKEHREELTKNVGSWIPFVRNRRNVNDKKDEIEKKVKKIDIEEKTESFKSAEEESSGWSNW